jgi:hypothetical protein
MLLTRKINDRPARRQERRNETATRHPLADLIVGSCGRPSASNVPVHARITQLVAAGAWTDAALALIELELPEWSLRRLAYDDGEWHCSLSRNRAIPLEFDDSADGRDELLPVAIVNAFLEARRPRAVTAHSRAMRPANPGARLPVVCDNFA